jgi:hypothetical protein
MRSFVLDAAWLVTLLAEAPTQTSSAPDDGVTAHLTKYAEQFRIYFHMTAGPRFRQKLGAADF